MCGYTMTNEQLKCLCVTVLRPNVHKNLLVAVALLFSYCEVNE